MSPHLALLLILGLVTQIMFESGLGSFLVQTIAIERYIEYFGLSRAILFVFLLQKKRYSYLRSFYGRGIVGPREQIPPT
jgi:hypothetical protein